jgi:hypothetical protein
MYTFDIIDIQDYRKLNSITGLIRSNDPASDFLDGYSANSDILALYQNSKPLHIKILSLRRCIYV